MTARSERRRAEHPPEDVSNLHDQSGNLKSLNFWGGGALDTNGEGAASQLTLGVSHRFSPTNNGAFPFVMGGLDFSSVSAGRMWGAHVGAGATFWTSRHHGLRMEVHNVIWSGALSFDEIVGRIGLTFR